MKREKKQNGVVAEQLDTLETIAERLDTLETMAERLDKLETVAERLETIAERLDKLETIAERLDTVETIGHDLQEQVAGLREAITGVDGGHYTYSLEEIGRMLKGLQIVLESQYKAKAFEVFDAYPASTEAEMDKLFNSAQAYTVLAVPGELSKEWFKEWQQQRKQQKP